MASRHGENVAASAPSVCSGRPLQDTMHMSWQYIVPSFEPVSLLLRKKLYDGHGTERVNLDQLGPFRRFSTSSTHRRREPNAPNLGSVD